MTEPLFVVNLCASATPVALQVPTSVDLRRYSFFVTRQREAGRDRFRLHMGYFATRAEADALLPVVRDVYPAAWTGPAPAARSLPAPGIAAAPVPPAPPANTTPATKAASGPPPAPAPVAAPRREVEADDDAVRTMNNLRAVLAELGDDPPPEVAAQIAADPRPVPAAAQPAPLADHTLSDSQVLAVLEQGTPAPVRAAPVAFAVQLAWSATPIDPAALPQLPIFDACALYQVESRRDGRSQYGLRLGFFPSLDAARQVAGYVRDDYAAASVVPVTAAEREHALSGKPGATGQAGESRAQAKLDAPRAPALTGLELIEDARPAAPKPARPAAPRPASAETHRPVSGRAASRRAAPQSLEHTLDILGADGLSLDTAREAVHGHARRGDTKKTGMTGRFTNLLTRLAAR